MAHQEAGFTTTFPKKKNWATSKEKSQVKVENTNSKSLTNRRIEELGTKQETKEVPESQSPWKQTLAQKTSLT